MPQKYLVKIDPMGAPRMTRADRWRRRPVVLRYMAYKDAICKACLGVTQDPLFVVIVADIPMPDSWSKKKRKEMLLQYHRSKPDWDNIGKGICDALWESDSVIAVGTTIKRWAETGSLFITVTGANEA